VPPKGPRFWTRLTPGLSRLTRSTVHFFIVFLFISLLISKSSERGGRWRGEEGDSKELRRVGRGGGGGGVDQEEDS
jgi:preprotein translocase subunit SecG